MRLAPLILFVCLLCGCSSEPVTPQPGPAATPAAPAVTTAPTVARFQLSGSLLTPPAGSVVELALLLVDSKNRPKDLLASNTLVGTGQPLPFTLGYSRDTLPADLRPQLRARVSLSGHLVQRLPGKPLSSLDSSDLGALQLVKAP